MIHSERYRKKFILFFTIFCNLLASQNLIIKDFYTKNEISNVKFYDIEAKNLINAKDYKLSKKILIQKEFYNDLIIEVDQINNSEIFLLPKFTDIEEIVIPRNNFILSGNISKSAVTGKLNEAKEMESVCANLLILDSQSKISSFNFFIYDINKKSHIQFVVYEFADNELGTKIYNQNITQYTKGWNELILEQKVILPKGKYYFGIQYIVDENENDIFKLKTSKGVRTFRGPVIGLSKNNVDTVFFGKERNYNFDKYNFMQYLKIYKHQE